MLLCLPAEVNLVSFVMISCHPALHWQRHSVLHQHSKKEISIMKTGKQVTDLQHFEFLCIPCVNCAIHYIENQEVNSSDQKQNILILF